MTQTKSRTVLLNYTGLNNIPNCSLHTIIFDTENLSLPNSTSVISLLDKLRYDGSVIIHSSSHKSMYLEDIFEYLTKRAESRHPYYSFNHVYFRVSNTSSYSVIYHHFDWILKSPSLPRMLANDGVKVLMELFTPAHGGCSICGTTYFRIVEKPNKNFDINKPIKILRYSSDRWVPTCSCKTEKGKTPDVIPCSVLALNYDKEIGNLIKKNRNVFAYGNLQKIKKYLDKKFNFKYNRFKIKG